MFIKFFNKRRMSIRILKAGQGILINTGHTRYALDKVSGNVAADYNLITHAHIDHLPYNPRGRVYASKETLHLARLRGYRYRRVVEEVKDVEDIDSGHILGSKAFLIEGKILYTGDFNIWDRLFLKGFKPPKTEILIIEATYGAPDFIFGEFNKLLDKLLSTISRYILEGRNIVLEAFPLGKLQLISEVLKNVKNVYLHNEVYKYNRAYKELGYIKEEKRVFKPGYVDTPFILLSPIRRLGTEFMERYDPVSIYLSGWAVRMRRLGIPISDHVDFNGLIKTIEEIEPKKIYVAYGYSLKFSKILSDMGYNAEPI